MAPAKKRVRADTQVGPYRFYCSLHQPLETGRGQRPAPTVDECPMPVQDLPGHPHPRLPQTKTPGMTAGTKASLFRPPSQRPPQARSEAPVLLSSPVPFGIVSKGRAAALPLVVSRRVWEENSKSLPESFLGSARGYSFDSKRISSRKPPIFVGGSPRPLGRGPHASCRGTRPDAIRPKPPSFLGTPGRSACPASAKKREPPAAALFPHCFVRSYAMITLRLGSTPVE